MATASKERVETIFEIEMTASSKSTGAAENLYKTSSGTLVNIKRGLSLEHRSFGTRLRFR